MNMLRLRVSTECQPRSKNGPPAHNTTGVARISWTQFDVARANQMIAAEQMVAHLQEEHGHGQRQRRPKIGACMSTSSGFGPLVGGHLDRLQSHAANRARARTDLADLRMHWAGVDRARRHRLRRRFIAREILLRIGGELAAAARRAKIVRASAMLGAVLGGMWIDVHPTHRVLGAGYLFGGRLGILRAAAARRRGGVAGPVVECSGMDSSICGREGGATRLDQVYPPGVYVNHAADSQILMSEAPWPDRGPGTRHRPYGRRGSLLHRYRHPISAVRAALRRVEQEVLGDHVAHCVEHAIASGNVDEQRRKVAELMDVFARADR